MIMREKDITDILNIPKSVITQKVMVTFSGSLDLAYFLTNMVFRDSGVTTQRLQDVIVVNGEIAIQKQDANNIALEWVASRKNDIIADQLGFLFSQVTPDSECDIFNELRSNVSKKAIFLLTEAFPGIIVHADNNVLNLQIGDQSASINIAATPIDIQSDNENLTKRIESVLVPYLHHIQP